MLFFKPVGQNGLWLWLKTDIKRSEKRQRLAITVAEEEGTNQCKWCSSISVAFLYFLVLQSIKCFAMLKVAELCVLSLLLYVIMCVRIYLAHDFIFNFSYSIISAIALHKEKKIKTITISCFTENNSIMYVEALKKPPTFLPWVAYWNKQEGEVQFVVQKLLHQRMACLWNRDSPTEYFGKDIDVNMKARGIDSSILSISIFLLESWSHNCWGWCQNADKHI